MEEGAMGKEYTREDSEGQDPHIDLGDLTVGLHNTKGIVII